MDGGFATVFKSVEQEKVRVLRQYGFTQFLSFFFGYQFRH